MNLQFFLMYFMHNVLEKQNFQNFVNLDCVMIQFNSIPSDTV